MRLRGDRSPARKPFSVPELEIAERARISHESSAASDSCHGNSRLRRPDMCSYKDVYPFARHQAPRAAVRSASWEILSSSGGFSLSGPIVSPLTRSWNDSNTSFGSAAIPCIAPITEPALAAFGLQSVSGKSAAPRFSVVEKSPFPYHTQIGRAHV